ncbi:MAG: DUF1800 domain-containing protein [Alcanivoracaceae bacterium]|nr:DUF1800 domain-containing protein [Alcanivoracaceae bacterium]
MNLSKRKEDEKPHINFTKNSVIPDGFSTYQFNQNKIKPLAAIGHSIPAFNGVIATPNLFHRVLTKMGFGPTPTLIAHIQTLAGATDNDKILSYINEQLNPSLINDSTAELMLNNGYQTLNKTRMQLYQEHYRRPDEGEIPWAFHILPGRETFYATFVRATQSNKQLFEMMADFWHNHFNVYMDGDGIPAMFVHYDRDVIRTNALGNFRQMLEEVTKATCMLDYLGNAFNNKDAPNENFARELLELHTISAKNYLGHMPAVDVPIDAEGRKVGYVEEDVVEMARALTGWSYSGADYFDYQNGNIATGEFLYRDTWHDKDIKRVMGNNYSFDSNNPLKDMQDILDMLAEHPATAEFLATKLCRRFISDSPSQAIIDQVKDTLHQNWQAADQIKLGIQTLLQSTEFLNTWGEKIKRPFERTASAMRQLGYSYDFDPTNPDSSNHFWSFSNSGQNLFFWTTPNGYPDNKTDWLGASSIMSTWRFMQLISRWRNDADIPYNDILNQTLAALTTPVQRTANNIVNYWFERACGLPPDVDIQDKLANFMSFDDTSDPQGTDRNTAIDLSTNEWPGYNQERLFAVVSTIFLTSEFNYR